MDALKRVTKNWWADFRERHWFRETSLYRAMALAAHSSSVQFAIRNLTVARRFSDRNDMLRYCVRKSGEGGPANGMIAEFGVWKGESIRIICDEAPNDTIIGFDSFEGLPEDWGAVLPKEFFSLSDMPEAPRNARLIKGWFSETLPAFLEASQGPFRFIHLDADLYSSTKDVLDAVYPRLDCGTVIVFDELLNVVDWEKNEYRALKECLIDRGVAFSYLAFHSEATLGAGTAVAIKIDAAPPLARP